VVTLKSTEIEMWVNELRLGLDTLVDQDDMNELVLPLLQGQLSPADARQANAELLRSMNATLAKSQLFDRVYIMDNTGKVIVSTNPAYENLDFSDADFYKQGLQKPYITPPFHESVLNQRLVIVASHPIIAPGRGAVGVISGYSNLSVLENIMKEPAGLGQTGESYLMGTDYFPVTPLRFPANHEYTQVGSNGIHSALENKIRGSGSYHDYRGVPVLGVYTWLPTLQVALVVEQDQDEASKPLSALLGINLGATLTAAALAVLVAFFVARRIATPIWLLSVTASRIAAGDLDQVAEVNRRDEIGTLANAFNRMTAQLRALIQELQADLVERERMENSLREAEVKYRHLVERLPQVIYTAEAGMQGNWFYVSPKIEQLLGFTPQEWMADPGLWYRQIHPDDRQQQEAVETQSLAENKPFEGEYRIFTKAGREIWLRDSGIFLPAEPGKPPIIQGTLTDVTERRRVEIALRQSDEHYRLLFENAPVGIVMADPRGQILDVNASALQILGSPSAQATKSINLLTFPPLIDAGITAGFKQCVETGQPLNGEYPYTTKWGKTVDALIRLTPIPDETGGITLIQIILEDISERRLAEKLQASTYEIARASVTAESLDKMYARLHEIVQTLLPTQYFYIALYDRAQNILSFPYFQDAFDIASPPGKPGHGLTEYVLRTGQPLLATRERRNELIQQGQVELIGADSMEWLGVPLIAHEQTMGVMVVQSYEETVHFHPQDMDVMKYVSTQVASAIERKRAEESLRESEERFHSLFDNATVGIYRATPSGQLLFLNPAGIHMLGYDTFEEIASRDLEEGYEPRYPRSQFIERMEREGRIIGMESAWRKKDGSTIYVRESAAAVRDESGNILYYDGTFEDITDRKKAEERVQQQMENLAALSMIDRIITSSFDLRNNLDAILAYTIRQLGVNAASILLLDPDSLTLSYHTWRGFRTKTAERAQVRIGNSVAGRAAMQHTTVNVAAPDECPDDPFLKTLLQREGFASYYGVPLLVKGRALGVLEVFHREAFHPGEEWLEFLNTLAGQTAIAIDNSQLFEGLQRSNLNLTLAYDATIEGWSRAMDLRDQETEGHTQRVAKLTLNLACALNIPDASLIHIRRGALLHDIGKLGIPDRILLKPTALTKKEMEIMRRHPTYAYEMLNPIAYLRPAIDIPYCHHEKWDGSGYPRGLKGEDIPIAARLFAVVDVWDALRSTRRYRAAWSVDKVRQYLRDESGKHFDPRAVEAFLGMIDNQP
jgi:PAS domain S-box-containing protein